MDFFVRVRSIARRHTMRHENTIGSSTSSVCGKGVIALLILLVEVVEPVTSGISIHTEIAVAYRALEPIQLVIMIS